MWRGPGSNVEDKAAWTRLRLQELYPDVPIYTSMKKLIEAHPLSDPRDFEVPMPSPANDPNFWNRRA